MKLAFDDFNRRYRDKIVDLTTAFPADARNIDAATKADMGPFWHGHKRFPKVATFDSKDPAHVDYVYQGACLYASIFGIPTFDARTDKHLFTPEMAQSIVSKLKAEPYKKGNVQLEEKKKTGEEQISQDDYVEIDKLSKYLSGVDVQKYGKIVPVDFEKDDDSNHHIDWITAATNMRSWNYSIEKSEKHNVRLTAGRIIPAIATTTAAITGFVQLEVFKYVLGLKFDTHRQVTIDLASNTFTCETLDGPKMRTDFKEKVEDEDKSTEFKKEYKLVQWRAFPEGKGFSVWDKIVINKGDISFNGLVKELETLFPGIKVDSIFKYKITPKEVADGKGVNLYSAVNQFANQYKNAMANKDKTTNAGLKASYERDITNYNNAEKKKDESVAKKYLSIYGDLITKDRNYFMLDAKYTTAKGEPAIAPPILFVFKEGSWVVSTAGSGGK